jgi:beta-lactamase class A
VLPEGGAHLNRRAVVADSHPTTRASGRSVALRLLVVAVMLLTTACVSPGAAPAVAPPGTPAGAQLRWLVATLSHLPLSEEEARAHVDPGYLAMISPEGLDQWLQELDEGLKGDPRLVSITVDEPDTAAGIVSAGGAGPRARVGLSVGSRGLIGDLDIHPAISGPIPVTWADVDAAFRSVAPQVRLLVAEVTDGACQPVHAIDPATAAPFGSVVKLYVLAAVGNAVAAGTVRWDQPLTVTASAKSLPSGVLQYEPDGTRVTVREAAEKMISISDNTATDMLIGLVGRSAVEEALSRAGMADPARNRPFLTTRETFVLAVEPDLAQRYLDADDAGRRALLADTVDRRPLPDLAALSASSPRGDVGWFASADDICRAYAALAALTRRPGLSPIGDVLARNDDILELDPALWATTWRKGVGGPSTAGQAYLATTRDGRSYTVIVLAENLSGPIDSKRFLNAMKGAFTLAARG